MNTLSAHWLAYINKVQQKVWRMVMIVFGSLRFVIS